MNRRPGTVDPLLEKTTEAGRRTGRPTLQDASLKSERLMTVATDYFVEHGFNGATIDAIAQAADMGKQAVYTRFTDKERLFNAVIHALRMRVERTFAWEDKFVIAQPPAWCNPLDKKGCGV